jgi:ABC-2 type transport system ATP-binding protein
MRVFTHKYDSFTAGTIQKRDTVRLSVTCFFPDLSPAGHQNFRSKTKEAGYLQLHPNHMTDMLAIQHFRKSYHGQLALEIQELQIPAGIHWIQGINGSGKTTFFRSIAGMLPFDGSILLNGRHEISRDPVPYRLRVNYGEAEPNYPGFLSAWDLIQFVGKAKQAAPTQISDLIDAFGIGDFCRNPTGTYSSGMIKKTSLVMAFLGNPELILLDEPLITIDKKAVEHVYQLVNQYHDKKGVSFLLSSHQDFQLSELTVSNRYLVQDKKITLL